MKRAFASASAIVLLTGFVLGQSPESKPTFTSVEVRLTKAGATNGGVGFLNGGQVFARAATLLNLVATAYTMDEELISGGPTWLDSTRFDITTKAAAGTTRESSLLMLQTLLADRFKLVVHKQEKELTVYALTVGKRGSKLKESAEGSTFDCDQKGFGTPLFTLTCTHMTMKQLTPQLKVMGFLDHPVLDLTGLDKAYDFAMSLTLPGQRKKPTDTDTNRPPDVSVFEAVDKNLGLKLEAQKHPVNVLVIDNVIKPATDDSGVTSSAKKSAEFDVAEVRASKPGSPIRINNQTNSGRVEMTGVPMRLLLQMAFSIQEADRIVGLAKWGDTDVFDIIAKGPSFESNPDGFPQMMRALLVERFKLATHEDVQPATVFGLTIGKRGQKLKESDGAERSACKPSAANGKKVCTCVNTTMAEFVDKLPGQAPAYINHAVVDLTGLKGSYDFAFAWTIKGKLATGQAGGNDLGAAPVASDPTGDVTVFEAIDKDLGLKLELVKHPVPVVVIDHLERTPTEN
jgi:uncharacterized protein (TIGR03435 family)